MTCQHGFEKGILCGLGNFYTDYTEEGIFHPDLPNLKSWYHAAKLRHLCGVPQNEELCPGSTFTLESLQEKNVHITQEVIDKYQAYLKAMQERIDRENS